MISIDLKINLLQETKRLVETALNSTSFLNEIRNRSVEHENGFLKIVLKERSERSYGCRLHKWKSGYSDSDIHNHRWNMSSLILNGLIYADNYEPDIIGEPYNTFQFTPQDNSKGVMLYSGISYLRKSESIEYSKGQSYSVKVGSIHKISKIGNSGAITTMFSWGEHSPSAAVYSTKAKLPNETFQRAVTIEEVVSCLMEAKLEIESIEGDSN